MKCFKPAWDIAFTKDINMEGWRVQGTIPFIRQALWKKVEECRSLDSSFRFSSSPGSLPPSQPSSPPDPSLAPDDMLQTPSPPTSAPPPLAPLPPPPMRITPFPVAVCEALDYVQSIDLAGSGILDTQAVVMQNVRLVEAVRVIGEWRKASTVEEVNTNNMNNPIQAETYTDKWEVQQETKHWLCFRRARKRGRQQLLLMLVLLPSKIKRKRRRRKTLPPLSPPAPRS
jgi:hypothetical protein